MNVGDRIKNVRVQLGYSQEELANRCGMNRNSIYNYETGKRTPKTNDLEKISAALDVTVADLLGLTLPSMDEVENSQFFIEFLISSGFHVEGSTSSDGEISCMQVNDAYFIEEEIDEFRNDVLRYIDLLVTKQATKK